MPNGDMPMIPTPRAPLFVSHGSPTLVMDDVPARRALAELFAASGKPAAIVVASAHWTTRTPRVDSSSAPRTIHDFSGFAPELYRMRYPAPGAPQLAERVVDALRTAGFEAELEARGLDHGAWVPLKLAAPLADIPVLQLSLQPHLGAAHHFKLGQALAPLAYDDVLVLGSGSATHNLGELTRPDAAPPAWVREFDTWLDATLARGDIDSLIDYRRRAPHAARNHPTEEHFFPLLVALGAAGPTPRSRLIHSSFTFGVLSMAAFSFEGQTARKF